jgi:hypothetical protein
MNFLFLLFCLACRMWHRSKINYVFVFEYDTRHHLDWRQLAEVIVARKVAEYMLIFVASLFLLFPPWLFYVVKL